MAEVLLIWHKTQINQSIDQNGVNPMFQYSINTLFLYTCKWTLGGGFYPTAYKKDVDILVLVVH